MCSFFLLCEYECRRVEWMMKIKGRTQPYHPEIGFSVFHPT